MAASFSAARLALLLSRVCAAARTWGSSLGGLCSPASGPESSKIAEVRTNTLPHAPALMYLPWVVSLTPSPKYLRRWLVVCVSVLWSDFCFLCHLAWLEALSPAPSLLAPTPVSMSVSSSVISEMASGSKVKGSLRLVSLILSIACSGSSKFSVPNSSIVGSWSMRLSTMS